MITNSFEGSGRDMNEASRVADGLYRLVKHEEDHNPVFPSSETVVEVRGALVINFLTGREWPLVGIGKERSLYGPISDPYDLCPLEKLPRIFLDSSERVVAGAGRATDENTR